MHTVELIFVNAYSHLKPQALVYSHRCLSPSSTPPPFIVFTIFVYIPSLYLHISTFSPAGVTKTMTLIIVFSDGVKVKFIYLVRWVNGAYIYSTGSVQFGLFSARFGSAACLGAIEGEQNNEI